MEEVINIDGRTIGIDEHGAYGSVLDDESEFEVPEPLNFEPPPPPPATDKADDK